MKSEALSEKYVEMYEGLADKSERNSELIAGETEETRE